MSVRVQWHHAWAVVTGVGAAALVAADGLVRENGGECFMAPSHALLWTSVWLGGGLGLIGLASCWLMPRSQREFTAAFARLSLRDRLRWRHQKRNLLHSGWFLVPMYGLIAWCVFNDVFVVPAVFAANAVLFAALPRWALPAATPGRRVRSERAAADGPSTPGPQVSS